MPSRRTLLATATATVAAAFGGCTVVTGSDGTHTLKPDRPALPTVDATVAASDSVEWRPDEGYVEVTALLFEHDDGSGFTLSTRCRVESHDEDRPHSRFRATHDWSRILGEITAFDSNAQRTDSNPAFTYANREQRDELEWELSIDDPEPYPRVYRFASEFDPVVVSAGDRIARTTLVAEYEKDRFFGGTCQTGTTLQLEYGEGAAEDWEPSE
ncbi:hypothetical protein [Natronosalvus vescus]|uniref:hypothetical protein n=1 Tax=Natronosalvus vescus TaxID=2953881 RepID=UPI00209063BA|nr:hypothetical protein [Natronosalvus vescus]